ncbi:MAG: hypothetical protein QOF76_151 [Solirubrobacteraceae bacterium]|nr:hypothetical protein [Solirubrobacteraceae bacterium]
MDLDLYADRALHDSREVFARIREAGPAVWLPKHRMYAMGRFEDVRAALRDDITFVSGRGVAANPIVNIAGRGTTLFSDGEQHNARRRVLKESLGPKPLRGISARVDREAERVVDALVGRRGFDAVAEFSSRLPVTVVAELVGLGDSAERLLRWAAATFDGLGPMNRRGLAGAPTSLGMVMRSLTLTRRSVRPGSWGASVFDARDRGDISSREARMLIIDFVAPALDTTILASTHLLWALAHSPEAWEQIVADPSLIGAAVVENVRIASPIRGFTRYVAADTEVGGVSIPRGSRVAMLYGAANLDETRFPDPERFDIHRRGNAHLGWGNGPHACAGSGLAKLEMQALLKAMVPRVSRVSVERPVRLRNNTLQGFSGLTASMVAA